MIKPYSAIIMSDIILKFPKLESNPLNIHVGEPLKYIQYFIPENLMYVNTQIIRSN